MEIANPDVGDLSRYVRPAGKGDRREIVRLLQRAEYRHIHVGWRYPVDWLGHPGFVVLAQERPRRERPPSLTSTLFSQDEALCACLAATADPQPAAWVRVAAVTGEEAPGASLSAMMTKVEQALRGAAVHTLGWLAIEPWPGRWLPSLGFTISNEIETYWKDDLTQTPVTQAEDINLRRARVDDLDRLVQIEEAAFMPLWRHSAGSLRVALSKAWQFDVALFNKRVVGFQITVHNEETAHLVRLTVSPQCHGRGVGSTLLARAIQVCREHDIDRISLNTQIDNTTSQILYRKFGFQPSGQRFPVWTKHIG